MSADPLAPVVAALLAAARADAEAVLARAEAEARGILGAGQQRAADLVAEARADAEAAWSRSAARERAAVRRRAHEMVQGARRAAYEDLRRRSLAEVEQLRGEPGHAALLGRLGQAARTRLGPAARISADGPEGSGVVAVADGRRVDLRLSVLTDRAIAALGPRLEELWE